MDVPSRDPIDLLDPEEANVSILEKGESYKLPDFTLQHLQAFAGYEVHVELLRHFRIRVAENSHLTCLNLWLASRGRPLKLPR